MDVNMYFPSDGIIIDGIIPPKQRLDVIKTNTTYKWIIYDTNKDTPDTIVEKVIIAYVKMLKEGKPGDKYYV